ncbi:hypothetical protein [Moorella sp. Hama-1]|nr:hypothetical protein [Moorella sp. Hama-1]
MIVATPKITCLGGEPGAGEKAMEQDFYTKNGTQGNFIGGFRKVCQSGR